MPKSALIVQLSGADNSSALKARLITKGYAVQRISISVTTGNIVWYAADKLTLQERSIASLIYDKVFIIGHHCVHPTVPAFRGVGFNGGLLSSDAIRDALVKAGLKQPSRFVLIICNAASGSSVGNVKDNDIGYSTGHNFASRLAEIDWFDVEVYAYTEKIGIIDERTNELLGMLLSSKKIQANQVLPIGSRYLLDSGLPAKPPSSVAGSKLKFYFQNKVLCCSAIY